MRSGFLLDTSFLSALFPGPQALPSKLEAWVIGQEHRFHLSTIAVAEIASGVANLKRRKAHDRASNYEEWLARIIRTFGDRILPVDVETAYELGALLDYSIAIGRHPGLADVAIAATAQLHGLIILTRNLKHFEPLGVPAIDPFETLPS